MERHVFRLAVLLCLLGSAAGFAAAAMAGTPGLPFSEDFSDAALKDDTLTNANWSTEEQALVLAWRREQYGGFYDGSTVVGSNISDDADYTRALAGALEPGVAQPCKRLNVLSGINVLEWQLSGKVGRARRPAGRNWPRVRTYPPPPRIRVHSNPSAKMPPVKMVTMLALGCPTIMLECVGS